MLFWQESLQRNPANQSLTHLWLAPKLSKLQLWPAAVCYLGQCPTVSPERMAFEHGKKGHYKGFKGEALAGERGLLAPAPHSPLSGPGLAPWTGHGRRKRCWPETPFIRVNKQTPHGKGLLCLSHGEPSVPQLSTGGKGHGFSPWGWRGEGRRGQEVWWQTLLQHSWHQQRWERSCLRREVSTLQQHGESIMSQFGIYMEMKASCQQGYRDNPKYPNQHNSRPKWTVKMMIHWILAFNRVQKIFFFIPSGIQ